MRNTLGFILFTIGYVRSIIIWNKPTIMVGNKKEELVEVLPLK